MIQYPYAHNDKNELIHIDSITKENKNDTVYRCPCCGYEMRPRLGNKQSHCFYHLPGIELCSLESYLHKTAKEILFNRFKNKEDEINIKVINTYVCNEKCNEKCDLCKCTKKQEINLNEVFDLTPELETYDNNFKPDILLKSSKGKVLYIEICYTHKCEEKKINSGNPIIEIYIDDVNQLKLLETYNLFFEIDDWTYNKCTTSEYYKKNNKYIQCKFYNFNTDKIKNKDFIIKNRKQEYDDPYCLWPEEYKRNKSQIRRLILYDSYKTYDYGILKKEIDDHKYNALMDITYNKYIIKNPRLILAKYDYRARSCYLCNNCVNKFNFDFGSNHTWCDKGKNGTSKKNTFNELNAIKCILYNDSDKTQWQQLDNQLLHITYDNSDFKYKVYINPKYKDNKEA